jgi:hypothetical protein
MKCFPSLVGMIGLLVGCATEPEGNPDIIQLEPREQLIRLSVDLLGVHPSEEELLSIESNPDYYQEFVERYLDDPRFVEQMKHVFNLRYLTRTGMTYGQSLDGFSNAEVAQAINEEPLELLAYIIENDLPYSEIVTADYTMANPLLSRIWNLDYPTDQAGWQPARYLDGRPHAGVLSMNGVWQAYPSMGGNANRHRANALSKMLLCDDYLSRPVVINRAAVDQLVIDPEDAISTNPSCQSCHASLDPLASHFFGFFPMDDEEDTTLYRPEREEGWRMYADKDPAYYGTPTANLSELGAVMAEDTRFVECAVQTVYEGIGQRIREDADWTKVQKHREVYVSSEFSIKSLVRSIVTDEEYLAKNLEDDELADRLPTIKVVNPYQLSSIIEDITEFKWNFNGVDALTNNGMGLPVLLGGVDGTVTQRNYLPSVGLVFVQERLAQAAGWHVAEHDLDRNRTDDAILLKFVTVEDTPEANTAAFEEQIRYLYLRITGKPLAEEAPEMEELMLIWDQLHSVKSSPTQAWSGVLSAILRDPAVITY